MGSARAHGPLFDEPLIEGSLAVDPVHGFRRPAGLATAATAPARPDRAGPLPAGPEVSRRPDLVVVPDDDARRGRPRVLAATVLVAGVGGVLVAQLLLSIQTAEGAYALERLEATSTDLSRQQQVQVEALETLASPQHLAARAAELGMVPAGAPVYLDATTGRVLGKPAKAATAPGTADDVPNALLPAG